MQKLLIIKKLKKDSTVEPEFSAEISGKLIKGDMIVFPVDGVYGLLSVYSAENAGRSEKALRELSLENGSVIITNFNMLEQSASITKKDYDFLRRIWPDEINVILKGNIKNSFSEKITVRIPRFQFILDIISQVSRPLVFYPLVTSAGKKLFKKKELSDKFGLTADLIVYLNEWSRAHVNPTLIDISADTLEIMEKGKVAVEEIQSLFFLDTSDDGAL